MGDNWTRRAALGLIAGGVGVTAAAVSGEIQAEGWLDRDTDVGISGDDTGVIELTREDTGEALSAIDGDELDTADVDIVIGNRTAVTLDGATSADDSDLVVTVEVTETTDGSLSVDAPSEFDPDSATLNDGDTQAFFLDGGNTISTDETVEFTFGFDLDTGEDSGDVTFETGIEATFGPSVLELDRQLTLTED